jgi:hypothetical protein
MKSIRLPTLNSVLRERYDATSIDNLRGQKKVVDESEDAIEIINNYSMDDVQVNEHIIVDRISGRPTYARKQFDSVKTKAKPNIIDAIGKMSDNTNGVLYKNSSIYDRFVSVEASVSPNGEIDAKVVKYFREIEAIVHLSNQMSR